MSQRCRMHDPLGWRAATKPAVRRDEDAVAAGGACRRERVRVCCTAAGNADAPAHPARRGGRCSWHYGFCSTDGGSQRRRWIWVSTPNGEGIPQARMWARAGTHGQPLGGCPACGPSGIRSGDLPGESSCRGALAGRRSRRSAGEVRRICSTERSRWAPGSARGSILCRDHGKCCGRLGARESTDTARRNRAARFGDAAPDALSAGAHAEHSGGAQRASPSGCAHAGRVTPVGHSRLVGGGGGGFRPSASGDGIQRAGADLGQQYHRAGADACRTATSVGAAGGAGPLFGDGLLRRISPSG
jgi:hypothetical protein